MLCWSMELIKMIQISKLKNSSSGCMILICGFLAWVVVLGIFLAVIAFKNHKIVYATIGQKIFNPFFVQQLDKNLSKSDFITFSNSYFSLIKEVEVTGLNKNTIIPITNILTFAQDKKITKSELELFSNSVWKTVNRGKRTEDR